MRKIISVIALLISTLVFSICISAEDIPFGYTVKEDGTAVIKGFDDSGYTFSGDLVIPTEIDGYTVTEISENAFRSQHGISSVKIPDTVYYIGPSAFKDCLGMSEVVIPSGVVAIDDYAFQHCTYLGALTIPDSVIFLGKYAFSECYYLSDVSLGRGLEDLYEYTFSDCKNLQQLSISDNLRNIGYSAFSGTPGCTIHYSGSKNQWDNVFFYSGNEEFLERSVVYMNSEADTQNEQEEKEIQFGYRENDDGTASITGLLSMDNNFDGPLEIPSEIDGYKVTEIYQNAFYCHENITSVIIPDTVTKISENAFYGCECLKEINFGKGVTYIGNYAFSNCESIETLVIPDNVFSLGDNVFADCGNLKEVTIGGGVTRIPDYAFSNCYKLKRVILGKNTDTIGSYAFSSCEPEYIYIPKTVTQINRYAFNDITDNTVINYDGAKALWTNISISSGNRLNRASINYNTDKDGNTTPTDNRGVAIFIPVYGIAIVVVITVIIIVLAKSERKCKNCGAKQDKSASFCTNCGKKL